MKTTFTQKYGSFLGILLAVLVGVAISTSSAYASMAAGVTINNTAHVDWAEDGAGTGQDSNAVSVTVNLVSGLVWDDTSLTPVTDIVAPGGAISYTADLLNLGNGSTTVSLTDNRIDTGLNADAVLSSSPTSAADLTLFGTVASGAGVFGGVTTAIPVYNLNVADLEVGTTRVHINGVVGTYFVVAAGSTATSLVVTGDASAVVAGDQLGEVINITYSGTAATLSASPTSGTHDHALLATDDVGGGLNADGNAAASDTLESDQDGATGADWVTSVVAGNLAVSKHVRNDTPLTVHNAGGVNPLAPQYGGVDYWESGITGNSGDVLKYIIQITNSGAGTATSVALTDTISPYVNLDTATISVDQTSDGTFESTNAIGDGLATYVAGTRLLTVNPVGSQIASGVTTTIIFTVTIQ